MRCSKINKNIHLCGGCCATIDSNSSLQNCIGILYNTILKYNNNRVYLIIKRLILGFGSSGFLDVDALSWEFGTIEFLGCEFVILGV